ncbi:MAG: STAS domain-containing protein [Spirochaetes bacterium]|nr:STAS domain-containing protein [Spirochaetota bacterium]
MPKNKIFKTRNGKNIILFFTNQIMALHSQALFNYLKPRLNKNEVYKVWIDFNNCTYIDSTTVGTLIKIDNILKTIDRELILCNLPEDIARIFQEMHLDSYFNIIKLEIFKKIANNIKEQIPVEKNKKVSLDFILDTHKCIVKISPEMEEEFKDLFSLLNRDQKKEGC